jgi:4-hydroxy-L-threonine phosphate dehydrogenase PdxA
MRDGSMDVFATGRYLTGWSSSGADVHECLAAQQSLRYPGGVAALSARGTWGRRIAIAIGDPNGIGPEIAVRAAAAPPPGVAPILVGDEYILRGYAERFAPGAELQIAPLQALERSAFKPGALDPRAGAATVAYMREAVPCWPVAPTRWSAVRIRDRRESCRHRLQRYTDRSRPDRHAAREELHDAGGRGLRIAHVTLHESVAQALGRLSPQLVVEAGLASAALLRRLGIAEPLIGVFGINPHAGEDGLFGDEDERITKPAVAELQRRGVRAEGPVGADLMLAQRRHDAYLAIFHDQGHIPIKLLSPLRASALAIGVPILFSSVAHGCAYDIAGQGIADPTAVRETLELLARARLLNALPRKVEPAWKDARKRGPERRPGLRWPTRNSSSTASPSVVLQPGRFPMVLVRMPRRTTCCRRGFHPCIRALRNDAGAGS